MPTINMLSAAETVKGQGVGSAFHEQVSLVSRGLRGKYNILVNAKKLCDIQHFHTINPEYLIPLMLERKRGANVGYVHFLPETLEESLELPSAVKQLFYKYVIEFYSSMDYIVTVNPYFISELEKYGIPRKKVTYIPNYVSEDMFYELDADRRQEIRSLWEIPENKFTVLGVGQVQTRKGIWDFVETARLTPDALFIWAGGFSFGPMTEGYAELKKLMADPPENVRFTGIVDRTDMNGLYNAADALFLPSFSELFPMTVLEAMCVSKPIILRDLDIYKEILFDYYLKASSVQEFADIISELMGDEKMYAIWSNKSYAGHRFYSAEHVLKLWEDFYDRVYAESTERQKKLRKLKLNKKDKEWIEYAKKMKKKLANEGKRRGEYAAKELNELRARLMEEIERGGELVKGADKHFLSFLGLMDDVRAKNKNKRKD